jgi:peptidoglycan/LPS O-acetylase OafA/YrhL
MSVLKPPGNLEHGAVPLQAQKEGDAIFRVSSLDGLRGCAAYLVALSHATSFFKTPEIETGQLGVLIFFTLSGFLLGYLYLDRAATPSSVADYAVRRAARIVPLYFFLVALSFVTIRITGSAGPLYSITPDNLPRHVLFGSGVNVFWTIPVEVQFYALFPLLWVGFRHGGDSTLAVMLGLIFGLQALAGFPQWPTLAMTLQYFLCGVAASRIVLRASPLTDLLFIAAVALCVLGIPSIRAGMGFTAEDWPSLLYLCTMFLLLVATVHSRIADRILGSRLARFAGTISYSVYLWHMVVAKMIESSGMAAVIGKPATFVIFFAATTAISWISFRLIELPGQAFIRRIASLPPVRFPSRAVPATVAALVVLGGVGLHLRAMRPECSFPPGSDVHAMAMLHNVTTAGASWSVSGADPMLVMQIPDTGARPCVKLVLRSNIRDDVQFFLPPDNAAEPMFDLRRTLLQPVQSGLNEVIQILPRQTAGKFLRLDPGSGAAGASAQIVSVAIGHAL